MKFKIVEKDIVDNREYPYFAKGTVGEYTKDIWYVIEKGRGIKLGTSKTVNVYEVNLCPLKFGDSIIIE